MKRKRNRFQWVDLFRPMALQPADAFVFGFGRLPYSGSIIPVFGILRTHEVEKIFKLRTWYKGIFLLFALVACLPGHHKQPSTYFRVRCRESVPWVGCDWFSNDINSSPAQFIATLGRTNHLAKSKHKRNKQNVRNADRSM